jgi:RNA polymerase sigma-70 factor (ECF subfamily)
MPNVVRLELRRRSQHHDPDAAEPADAPAMNHASARTRVLPMPRGEVASGWGEEEPDPDAEVDRSPDDTAPATDHEALDAEPPDTGPGTRDLPAVAGLDDAALAELIQRIVHQDEKALERLYDAAAARVYGLVLRIVQRAALAEEVLEDTFWQVWRQAPRFDAARGRPLTWVLAMARSRAIDALRREQRFQHDELPDDDVADACGASPPPQDLLEATRGNERVHAALASLEPRSRQLVALAFFRGLTHEEIAEQQGLPLGTVKSLIRRALQQLRRVMEAGHG